MEALIKKEPEARPSLQEILDVAYVRRYLGVYRDHISRHITERQTSFQRSLSQFNLGAIVQVSTDSMAQRAGMCALWCQKGNVGESVWCETAQAWSKRLSMLSLPALVHQICLLKCWGSLKLFSKDSILHPPAERGVAELNPSAVGSHLLPLQQQIDQDCR